MRGFAIHNAPTNHGGVIPSTQQRTSQMGNLFVRAGDGHYCPKCKVLSKAIATENGFMQINGRNPIVAGDVSTCGAKYIKISDLAVRSRGSGLLNNLHNIINKLKFDERVQLIDKDDNEPLANVPYYLKNSLTGDIVAQGTTDHNGYTDRFYTEK